MARASDDFPVLTTERMRLRLVEPRDATGLHACFGDPQAMRFWDFPPCGTMAQTVRIMRWLARTTSPHDHLGWAVADKRRDRCFGMVCYHHREPRNKRLEIGYIIAPAHQGRGMGTEAVRAVLDYCTGTLGAHRVHALIHPENHRSMQLVERLGFHCEGGPLTDYWRVGDSYRSAMLYAFVAPTGAAGPAGTLQAASYKHHHGRARKAGRARQ
ncbi:MAG: GNAT family N-acetyltransferase [Hyphomicrobiaceae bacterium]|nr:GNAT family N-acetyltransferase [Hyphomicrobiaceae bacterium]